MIFHWAADKEQAFCLGTLHLQVYWQIRMVRSPGTRGWMTDAWASIIEIRVTLQCDNKRRDIFKYPNVWAVISCGIV